MCERELTVCCYENLFNYYASQETLKKKNNEDDAPIKVKTLHSHVNS